MGRKIIFGNRRAHYINDCKSVYFNTTTEEDCDDTEIVKDSSASHKLNKDIKTSNPKDF